MVFRPFCLTVLMALALLAARPVAAETAPVDPVAVPYVLSLRSEGYKHIIVGETWLGRIQIVAFLHGARREIILHPTSGEVLRDYIEPPASQWASESSEGRSAGGAGVAAMAAGATTRTGTDAMGIAASVLPGTTDEAAAP